MVFFLFVFVAVFALSGGALVYFRLNDPIEVFDEVLIHLDILVYLDALFMQENKLLNVPDEVRNALILVPEFPLERLFQLGLVSAVVLRLVLFIQEQFS